MNPLAGFLGVVQLLVLAFRWGVHICSSCLSSWYLCVLDARRESLQLSQNDVKRSRKTELEARSKMPSCQPLFPLLWGKSPEHGSQHCAGPIFHGQSGKLSQVTGL
ncbi:hypothetical protein BJ170DRAFT_173245 [Xylariales sp. AK1849]|nr:hypothetical protein BJ170DRAFT_173245 [Xylariales sp. AK1849]